MNNDEWQKRAPWPFPPAWACAWGDDPYGLWADFALSDVVQRMRWVEPGCFMMGSPFDELGRGDREGPRHRVTISQGFWLADTACTQALWLALMGQNPSHFTAPEQTGLQLPVERVSWIMAQEFLQKLNTALPDCLFSLPTEAEWEYACRAGSETPFCFGETITAEQVNYNGNHPYGKGGKGEFRRRTVPVTALAANAWGLYQMHGNVWEWCDDALRQYSGDEALDPGLAALLGLQADDRTVGGAARALRGGSWFHYALFARSAYRYDFLPDGLVNYVGLRVACRSSSQARSGGAGGVL